ncbi:MAG: ABC transporter substrate-binding protein [Thermoplasmata archaeon]
MTGGGGASLPAGAAKRGISRGVFVASVVIVALIMVTAGLYVGKTVFSSSNGSSSSPYLVVGTNIPYPPFEDYNYSAGAYFGFDINFSVLIANALHRTLVIQNYADFSVLLADVGAGVVDMAASSITESGSVGAARNATMSFSIPYYDDNQGILVGTSSSLNCPVTNGSKICTATTLAPLEIGVQSGTTSQAWLQQYLPPSNETGSGSVTAFGTVDLELEALEAGSINAVMIDSSVASAIAAGQSGTFRVAGLIITDELYGFAVAHGDPEHILPVIDSVINQAMADGTYAMLIHEWFG